MRKRKESSLNMPNNVILGTVKKGVTTVDFTWELKDYNKQFIPSSTTLVISKDTTRRKQTLENICKTIDEDRYLLKINLSSELQLTAAELNIILTNCKKLIDLKRGLCKELSLEQLKTDGCVNLMEKFNEAVVNCQDVVICIDSYDLMMFEENYKSIENIKSLVNYINDWGKDCGVYLLLGMSRLNGNMQNFVIDNIDNIILLKPYNIDALLTMINNSVYKIISADNSVEQFCRANSITIDQLSMEPDIAKNGNTIYVYKS